MTSTGSRDQEKNMDLWYSSVEWKNVLRANEGETICVPPCLDVLKSWKRNDLDEAPHLAPNIVGQKGETAFMLKLQELNMGGILVAGLEFCDLFVSKPVPKEKIQKGEWDAIFFHQRRGIFVIEVKATETNDEHIVNKRMERAKTQLDRNIKCIKQSFLSLYQKECTCITGFICFPFRNEDLKTYEGCRIIDKSALNDRSIFRQFFDPQINNAMVDISLLHSFVAEFVCCRSQVEFHSQAYNAMQVATWIMEQDTAQKQDPAKLASIPSNGPSGKIILTAQQLEIVECREKCIIIHGVPGSGKTLILMLRALKAAMENKAGSVFIFANEKLKAKYEHFFFEEEDRIFVSNDENIDRRPKIHTIDNIKFVKPEDDVFFDETPVEDSYIEMIKSRVNCSGRTTVVFTGLHKPGEAVASFRLYRPRLNELKHFELMKVLRGTRNIFGEWEHYYPLGITIGHNIIGVAVKNVSFDSFEQVQNEIANKIATLTRVNMINNDLPSLKKEHIAVITCDDHDSTEIINYFQTKEILCGKVSEQARRLKSSSIVAVDVYLNTPSYEWPIVFVVLKPGVTKEEVLPIAASRCIASLTIFTYKKATASSIKADELKPTEEIFQKSNAQKSLKKMYLTKFKTVYPFSLPFTFDIENTWVSLALKGYWNYSLETEDHANLIERAFETDPDNPESRVKILIIEGDPATGKTSLMRKLAYGWAKGEQGLLHYDLVLYGEFREVREHTFIGITDLVLESSKKYFSERKNSLDNQSYETFKKLMYDEQFCEKHKTLVLLDGYDESSLEKQCTELNTYLSAKTIDDTPLFNIVITTRKGYLSHLQGRKGRFVFAEVLGFKRDQQKKKYIANHFASMKNSAAHIAAVHHLLDNNQNLNKLAITPLFLTFICLVHERIIDGTLLELYCSIIWWLIDRHQQDFPDRDIPCSFGFQNDSFDKFSIIQEHFLRFPQLQCLGSMALRNIEKNILDYFEYEQSNLQPIIEQVGLLRREKKFDSSFKLVTSFLFPHRTIQEFLAACYCFCSDDVTSERLLPNTELNTSHGMKEFERFLLRIALSDKMPINTEKRRYYFEKIVDIQLDITFDAFNTAAGFNNNLLNWFISQCTNVQNIKLNGKLISARYVSNMVNNTSKHNEIVITSKISSPTVISFSNLTKLHMLALEECTFEANFQLSITNCPSLNYLHFSECQIKSSTNLGFATLPAIDSLEFTRCAIDLVAWQSFIDQIRNSSLKCLKLTFREDFNKEILIHLQQCNNVEKMELTLENYIIHRNDLLSFNDLMKLHSLKFRTCTFETNSQLSFTNCLTLKNLEFRGDEIKSSANLGLATLPAFSTVLFYECKADLATWQSIMDQIRSSSLKCLKLTFREDFNKEFLIHLQKCNHIEKMNISIGYYKIHQNELISFRDLMKLHSLEFTACTFEANSQLLFNNCPSLKNLEFRHCKIESNTSLGIETLPAIKSVEFVKCNITMATWQSITDEIRDSSVEFMTLSADYFAKYTLSEFSHQLQKCERIQQIHINDVYDPDNNILNYYEEEGIANLSQTALKLKGLRSITISDGYGRRLDESRRLSERNKERIEKAGQERNPEFLIKYVD